ncbi:MFS general substrate transporter [Mycena indigotica]|uniref:MFS general substrate transporter n=1 Tax=Mycena indigotica TaxID=2126181 RepID=A0A8H6WIB4_9AGAR|nr:MFS general substrate transporter [Mycena indigotica]KAF7315948.1 MFS general substrate transporter [Mycena indigotica]
MSTTVEKPSEPKASLEKGSTDSHLEQVKSNSDHEFDFGGESKLPPPPQLTPEEERRIWRKVDLRLMPILSILYLFSFMDRGNIGNAKLDGLVTQLHLTGDKYNIALTMYFIPYCIFECPANLVLKKFRPSKWLPGITLLWGTVMTLMGLVKTYPQLVGVRVCLGIAEAGLFPGVVYYLSLWYPRHMLQLRIGYFFGAASMAGAFSGLLAYGINFMNGIQGLEGWSWIFILVILAFSVTLYVSTELQEGIATVAVGIVAFFILVDFPATAGFLTPEERSYLVWRKKYDNSSVGEEEHFEWRHLWQAVSDWQVWLHILIYMSIIGPLYGITLFLPTIISTFGHSIPVSQLLTVPPYVVSPWLPCCFKPPIQHCSAITLYVFAVWSDRIKKRWPFIYAGLIMLLIGFAINISQAPPGAKYFGVFFCVAGSYAAFPGVVAWLGNNLSGQYKRGVGMALHIGIGNFSGAIASNIYRAKDSPRFLVGHGCELMFVGIGLICVPIAVLSYKRINRARDEQAKQTEGARVYTKKELRELGDRAPDFRYTL